MRKIILSVLILTGTVIFTGCGKQARNPSVVTNQQVSVADVLNQGMSAAEKSTEPVEDPIREEETVIPTAPIEPIIPTENPSDATDAGESDDGVDVDLTRLSSTMVYAEVYSMLSTPRNYIGKIVRMRGDYSFVKDPTSDVMYHSCLIKDATACCSQGIEFVLKNDRKYPDDYPKPGQWMILQGEFTYYDEDNIIRNLALINADMKLADKQGYVN